MSIQTYKAITQHNVNIHWYLPDPLLIPLLARYPGTVPVWIRIPDPKINLLKETFLPPDD
jgi:hypothetical protein